MFGLSMQTLLLDAATTISSFAGNWLLQSTLLIVTGLLAARLLRRYGSAVQSAIFRATLVAALLCPIVTAGLAFMGVPGWSVEIPKAWAYRELPVSVGPDVVAGGAEADFEVSGLEAQAATPAAEWSPPAGAPVIRPASDNSNGPQRPVEPISSSTEVDAAEAVDPVSVDETSKGRSVDVYWFGWLAILALAAWLALSSLLLLRLALAWVQLSRLIRQAVPAEEALQLATAALARLLRVPTPLIRRSPFVSSPCLAGFRRPVMLLPATDLNLAMDDILIHELAHLRRHDCHWNLLSRLVTAVCFFQPLIWLLARQIETTAEEVCDDYVVAYGGRRQEYARQLVNVAELSANPLAVASVGIVSFRSMLAQRIARILDTSRSLSTRIGNFALAVVLLVAMVGTSVVAFVGLDPAKTRAEHQSEEKSEIDDSVISDDDVLTVSGVVLDPTGKPVPDASVYALRWYWDTDVRRIPLARGTSKTDGTFTLSYRKSQFTEGVPRPDLWKEVTVVATAKGFGPAWSKKDDVTKGGDLELKLAVDDVPITGRVVDLEGNPVSSVQVHVIEVRDSHGSLDSWLAALTRGEILWDASSRYLTIRAPNFEPGMVPDQTTDKDGRFRLQAIGRERFVYLSLQGPTTAFTQASIVTRPMEPIVAADGLADPELVRKTTVYGSDFQIAVPPTQPIEGIVRDAETRQTLAGVTIESLRMSTKGAIGEGFVHAVSDENGHYRLLGMPKTVGRRIVAIPRLDQPYFLREYDVNNPPGLQPVKVDIELHRGRWIQGRITNQKTGAPVRAAILYLPYLDNQNAQALPEFNENGYIDGVNSHELRVQTDADGYYRVVSLPGPAIVGVRTLSDPFPPGQGSEKLTGFDEHGGLSTYSAPLSPSRIWPTAIKRIDVSEDAQESSLDFELDPGHSITFAMVDREGKEVTGAEVYGLNGQSDFTRKIEGGTFEAVAFCPGDKRTILVQHKERRIGKILRVKATTDPDQAQTVTLESCIRVLGRITDDNGQPLSGARLTFIPLPGGDFHPDLATIATGDDGQFDRSDVLPGAKYKIGCASSRFDYKVVAKSLTVEAGEVIDLGTIDITSDDRPEPKRTKAVVAAANISKSVPRENGEKDLRNLEYAGKVVDPNGKPAAGAKIYLVYHVPQPTGSFDPTWKPLATTDQSGHFRFSFDRSGVGKGTSDWELQFARIVAVAKGFGFASDEAALFETSGDSVKELKQRVEEIPPAYRKQWEKKLKKVGQPLRLVKDDEPLRGQVVDINGVPVAGARLTLIRVNLNEDESLEEWNAAANKDQADFYAAFRPSLSELNGPQLHSLIGPVLSDSKGRFTIHGLGRQRIAQLLIEGPGIQSDLIFARTERGTPIKLLTNWQMPDLGHLTVLPAEFVHIAGPTVPIVGTVRDRATKNPLAGVTIKSQKRQGHKTHGWGQDFVRTETNADGQFRLEGMPIGSDNEIAAVVPDDRPYLPVSRDVEIKRDEREVTVDMELPPAVFVTGRVTDKMSGKGLPGRFQYFVFPENSNRAGADLQVDTRDRFRSDDDGRFRIPVLPGRGIIAFLAEDHERYPRGAGAEAIDGAARDLGAIHFRTYPTYCMPMNFHVVSEINPEQDSETIERNLQLDGGSTVHGRVLDPEGNALAGAYYSGKLAEFGSFRPIPSDRFEVLGYDPKKPRQLLFFHEQRTLAGHLILKGEVTNEPKVRLQPAGKVIGRIVDKDGGPLAAMELHTWLPLRPPAKDLTPSPPLALPPNSIVSSSGRYATDEQGRFEIAGLAPGVEYILQAFDRESMTPGRGRMPRISGVFDKSIKVKPGEALDLGDIHLIPHEKFKEKAVDQTSVDLKKENATPAGDEKVADGHVVHGRLTDPDGNPMGGAAVAVVAMRIESSSEPIGDVLAEGIAAADGSYRLTIKGDMSKSHRYAALIARKDGLALAWKRLDLAAKKSEVSLRLSPEEVIEGQLVDIEGAPAKDLPLMISSILVAVKDGMPTDGVGYGGEKLPDAWIRPVMTDADGRFTVHGVAAGQGVGISVPGNESFAPQQIVINSGMPEQRGPRDGTYRPLVKNVKPGEVAVLPLAPAQVIEGTATHEDTGEPAAHARISVWSGQQDPGGSMTSVNGTTNEQGKYRIAAHPGIRFGVTAYPPAGEPYLASRTPRSQEVRWKAGDRTRQLDVLLKRGILIQGKIIEKGSGTPIAGASIQYWPINNPNESDEVITGWQNMQASGDDGTFSIVVLPGPGRLMVFGPDDKYVLQELSSQQLYRGKPGGGRYYVCGTSEINPAPDSGPLQVSIEVERGQQISGTIVGPEGEPVDECFIFSKLNVERSSLKWRGWRGHALPPLGGKFELSGLAKDQEYTVYFLDAKRRLGTSVTLTAKDQGRTIQLAPCGILKARLVDSEAKPIAGAPVDFLRMVMTPGAYQFDEEARKRGEPTADSDFIGNCDPVNFTNARSDNEGRVSVPALIPGALYQVSSYDGREWKAGKTFSVTTGETIDLGDIVVSRP